VLCGGLHLFIDVRRRCVCLLALVFGCCGAALWRLFYLGSASARGPVGGPFRELFRSCVCAPLLLRLGAGLCFLVVSHCGLSSPVVVCLAVVLLVVLLCGHA
jgi:hypothetical protein